jgi:PhnB protein
MTSSLRYVRHGRGSVRPYVHGPAELPEFLATVFKAIELERHEFGPNSFHVELAIGDSVVVVEAGELPPGVTPWTGSVYVYVEDADAAHARALSLGAKSISAMQDKPYRERQGGFTDSAGNTWWVSTYRDA